MIRVCSAADVPLGEGRNVTIAGLRLAVFHADSGWYALDAACPHLQGPLADGIVAEASVICPLHERRFSLLDGREVGGSLCVRSYPVALDGGDVYVQLDVLEAAA